MTSLTQPSVPKPRVASLFAGIGGIDLAFLHAGARIVYANELDKRACETYAHNLNGNKLYQGDIRDQHIPVEADIITAGFPCQPFSVAGFRKGFGDDRGYLALEVIRLVHEARPKAVFMENVKGLYTHDHGLTYRTIREALESEGYSVTEKIMNTSEYSMMPQNRERLYIVAFRDPACMERFSFPEPIPNGPKLTLDDIIKPLAKRPAEYYYAKDHPYYPKLDATVRKGAVYQWRRGNIRENKSGVCPTLTANMGTGGHNVPIVRDQWGIRKLTPRDCLELQGFPRGYAFPDTVPLSQRYKQVGNSVSVPVVTLIAERMIRALNGTGGP